MNLSGEQLQRLEIIERIAFERGHQVGLSSNHWESDAVDDLLSVDLPDKPITDAFRRGVSYGEREWTAEFENEED